MTAHRRYFQNGLCPVWPSGKKCYHNINQARWDLRVMETRYPDDRFAVFKCQHCKHWHIGRTKEADVPEA